MPAAALYHHRSVFFLHSLSSVHTIVLLRGIDGCSKTNCFGLDQVHEILVELSSHLVSAEPQSVAMCISPFLHIDTRYDSEGDSHRLLRGIGAQDSNTFSYLSSVTQLLVTRVLFTSHSLLCCVEPVLGCYMPAF